MERPLLLLSDTHLSRDYGTPAGEALSQVVRKHRDCEVVLVGDIFDLSLDSADTPRTESLLAALTPHTGVIEALREQVGRGQKVTFIPGNHDSGLHGTAPLTALRKLLGASDDRTIEVASWFIRRGSVHIEHGHLYDPDCANNHPLAPPNAHSEGLGTALMRRFLAPNNALFLAHKNHMTLTSGLRTAFQRWGMRAPLVIASYMETAAVLCAEAGLNKKLISQERALGDALIGACAEKNRLPQEALFELLRIAPLPTHHSLRATFQRLYFDRVLALLALSAGVTTLAGAGLGLGKGAVLFKSAGALTGAGAVLTLLGGGYLGLSTALHKNRYGHQVVGQLDRAADEVRRATSSSLVVFGHTHVEVERPGYFNLGSFSYGRPEHPYALISRDENIERHRWSRGAS